MVERLVRVEEVESSNLSGPTSLVRAMAQPSLHKFVLRGDLSSVRQLFNRGTGGREVNAYDDQGFTPLMHAVGRPGASIELVRFLLDHGAEIERESKGEFCSTTAMALALGAGDPDMVDLLIKRGGNIHYRAADGYTALVHAVHGRDIFHDKKLIDLLRLLIANGVELNGITKYGESGLRVLGNLGRFDAVGTLLDAGADCDQLKWTPLLRTVALGSLEDVRTESQHRDSLEDRDWWERTPFLLAIQTGDVTKALCLYNAGSDPDARGRCEKPNLFYAIESDQISMLDWLIEIGADINITDKFGNTPLMEAAESNNPKAVDRLLQAGANVNLERNGQIALAFATTRQVALRLLDAGSDIQQLSSEGRRAILGLEPQPNPVLLDISPEEFREARTPRFGTANPHFYKGRFYEAMVRAGISAYQATELFRDTVEPIRPTWCAQRFGQSLSFLPDGRTVQIGGEHEDFYDSDFCIYNDVFVHLPGGEISILGYPEDVFPPTDFHTATLLSDHFIWIIGSLGYAGKRHYGETPVYRLDTDSFRIEKMNVTGNRPGWIYGHTATAVSGAKIRVSGGKIVSLSNREESNVENHRNFELDIERLTWVEGD